MQGGQWERGESERGRKIERKKYGENGENYKGEISTTGPFS